jgi:hypothetical protein
MPYRDSLKRWVVVRFVSATDRSPVARFVKFSDAEGHAQALNRQHPTDRYLVMFAPKGLPDVNAVAPEISDLPLPPDFTESSDDWHCLEAL